MADYSIAMIYDPEINTFSSIGWAEKKFTKLFLSELHQISTKCDNFWRTNNQDDRIMWDALIFHLT